MVIQYHRSLVMLSISAMMLSTTTAYQSVYTILFIVYGFC